MTGTSERVRQAIRDLVDLGISQKTIAAQLNRHQSWVTRYIDAKAPSGSLTATDADRFYRYVRKLRDAAERIGSERFATEDDSLDTPRTGDLPRHDGRDTTRPSTNGGATYVTSARQLEGNSESVDAKRQDLDRLHAALAKKRGKAARKQPTTRRPHSR